MMIASKFLISNCAMVFVRANCGVRHSSGGHWLNKKSKELVSKATKENVAPLHKTTETRYPAAAALPLPTNVEEFEASEKARFSPQRARDISGPVITAKAVPINWDKNGNGKMVNGSDPHVVSYDCSGAVSLCSVMQTNVPQPFSSSCKSTYLNMPGGQWGQSDKYVAEDMRNSLFSRSSADNPEKCKKNGNTGILFFSCVGRLPCSNNALVPSLNLKRNISALCRYRLSHNNFIFSRHCSTNEEIKPLSQKEKLKQAVKDYGATVIIFHVGISLLSLGGFYLAVSSGLDVAAMLRRFGATDVAAGASTFVMAYAVHKVFAPVRISITLAATPFIVRYLRRIGVLKVKSQ